MEGNTNLPDVDVFESHPLYDWTPEQAIGYRQQFRNQFDVPDDERLAAEAFDDALTTLPRANLQTALGVFRAMVASGSAELRMAIALGLDHLHAVDSDAALPLWHDLLGNESEENSHVVVMAYDTLKEGVEEGLIPADEAEPLLEQYKDAEARAGARRMRQAYLRRRKRGLGSPALDVHYGISDEA